MNTNEILTRSKAGLDNSREVKKLRMIESLLELLDKIDYTAEVVPFDDPDRFSRLLASLKGEPLSVEERELVKEIMN